MTREENRLLRYPPTRNTWYCPDCAATCYGSDTACWVCATGKRENAIKLAWPAYELALEKAEREDAR